MHNRVKQGVQIADTDLLRVLATELKAPLLHIAGTSQLLQNDAYSQIELEEQYRRLSLSSEHMLQLIDALLLAGKVETRQVQLELEPLNISATVWGVQQSLQPLALRYGRSIHVSHTGKALAPVSAHKEAFERSLYTIMDTVIRSSQSEVVEVATRHRDDRVVLSISDDGHIMSASALHEALQTIGKRTQLMKQIPGTAGLSMYVAEILSQAQFADFMVKTHKHKRVITFSFQRSQQLRLSL